MPDDKKKNLFNFFDSTAAFDPEGSGYDYETAEKFGITADSTGHLPSRVPETGQLLKGKKHPTFDKTLEAEEKLGFQISKGADGKLYSKKKAAEFDFFDSLAQTATQDSTIPTDLPEGAKYLSEEELKNFKEQTQARLSEIDELRKQKKISEEEALFDITAGLGQAAKDVGEFATRPLKQAGQILGEAGEKFEEAFTPTGDVEKGISSLLSGIAKTGEAPIAATLGYLNQLVEPVATAAAETDIGKAIDESDPAQLVNRLLTEPATTAMEGISELTGLEPPSEGALELGDLIGNLLMFKGAESAIFPKIPKATKFGDVKVSKARLKELAKDPDFLPSTKAEKVVKKVDKLEKIKKAEAEVKAEKPAAEKPSIDPNEITGVKARTLGEMSEGVTLDSPKLGEYTNTKLPTVQVMKKLKEHGMFDEAVKMGRDLAKGSKFDVVKGTTLETVARVMLKNIEALKAKAPKVEVKPAAKPKPAADIILETPVKDLPKGINKKVLSTVDELITELKAAEIKKTAAFDSGRMKSTTINTFPDWFSQLNRNKKDVLAALEKIKNKDVVEKGTLVEDLKATIIDRLSGKHEEAVRTGVSGKFKREVLGEIPADAEFVELMKGETTLEGLGKKIAELEGETSFKPGVDFPTAKLKPVETLKEYQEFKKTFKDQKLTEKELIDELFTLEHQRKGVKPSENPYLFRQSKDVAAELGRKTNKDIIVDAKNVWVDAKRVGSAEQLTKLLETKKPAEVKLTPEAAKRKAAAEGIKPAAPKAEPKTVFESMKQNKEFTVKTLADETGLAPKKISETLRELQGNKLIEKTDKGYKPTAELQVLLDDMATNPKKYQIDVAKLHSNPIPEILKGLSKAATFLDDVFEKALGRPLYNQLAKGLKKIVPEKIKEQLVTNYGLSDFYLGLKSNAKDAIARYNELATEIGDLLEFKEGSTRFTKAEQKRLAQITKGSVTTNPLLKARGTRAIKEIAELEKLGKELEVLPIETYNTKLPRKRINELLTEKRKLQSTLDKIQEVVGEEVRIRELENRIKNLDKKVKDSFVHGGEGYMKRVFLSKEQQGLFSKYGYFRPTRLDLTSALHRKDIPYPVRKQMGEVLTAAYPVSKGILLEGKDVSLGNFFKAVSEHPDWVSPSERPGFVQMPNTKKLGKLQNKFVEERIAKDINDVINLTKPEGMDAFLKEVNSIWKATKTIMNPSTHFRNIMSNSVMLDFSGVSHLDQARIFPDALKAVKGKGKYAAEFKASRLASTTFAKEELAKYLDLIADSKSFLDLTLAEKAQKLWNLPTTEKIAFGYGKVTGVKTKLGAKLGELYQMEETVGKAIKFIAEREKGKSILEAKAAANKWLFDYGEIPKAVDFMRNNPLLGMPFVTWSYKALPRVIETAITRPVSFWKYPAAFSAITKYSLDKLDLTQEEWDKLKADFPDRLAQGEWLLVPFRDDNGKMQMLDLTYILPYKDAYDLAMSGYSLATSGKLPGEKNAVEGVLGMLNAPVTTMITELKANKNTYNNMPIWNETDTPKEQAIKWFDYMYKLYMPSLAPEIPGITEGGYSWHKLASTIKGKEDYYGRNFSLAPAIGSSLLGVKTTPIDPQRNRERKYYKLNSKVIEWSKKKSRIIRDATISKEDKKAKVKEIKLEIAKLKAEMNKLGVKP